RVARADPGRIPSRALRYVLYEASAPSSRLLTADALTISQFRNLVRPLRSIRRSPLLAIGNPDRVECSANHVITHTRKIFYAATADQHNRVLLQVVPDTGNIGRDFNPVGQPHTRHFAQRRIRLLGGLRIHTGANSTLLRTTLQ